MPNLIPPALLHPSPLRRTKLHELLSRRLEEMIRSGELKPGDRLPSERDMMSAFSIGRPAVREALLSLENKGIVVTENGRRASVRMPSVDHVFGTLDSVVGLIINNTQSLKNLFDARVFIEAAMARNAAVAINKASLSELKKALDANKRAIGNRALFTQTDAAFHGALFRLPGNPVFDSVHKALVSWLMERWGKIRRDNSTETLAYQGHLQIYKAVSRRDPDAAERAMRKHLSASWAIWSRELKGGPQ